MAIFGVFKTFNILFVVEINVNKEPLEIMKQKEKHCHTYPNFSGMLLSPLKYKKCCPIKYGHNSNSSY